MYSLFYYKYFLPEVVVDPVDVVLGTVVVVSEVEVVGVVEVVEARMRPIN